MQKLQSFTEQGNTTLTITGAAGTIARKVQGSFPSCTISVYLAGTVTLAPVYSDNALTPKANPFTAASDGTWFVYAPNGRYDVKFSGGGIAAPFTLGDFSLFDESILVVDVTAAPFFASTTASAAANAAAFTAALASMTTGVLYFPPGTYATNASLTPKTGVTFQGAGQGSTIINYSGSGDWLDLGATAIANYVGIHGIDIECTGAGLGGLRVGRTTQPYDAAIMRVGWSLSDVLIHSTASPMTANGYGISATEYIRWIVQNVTVNNFFNGSIWDRGGNSNFIDCTIQGFAFGLDITNSVGGCQDHWDNCEFLGPTTTGAAGVDYGFTVTVDATYVTFSNCEYETQPTFKSQGYLHLTNRSGRFTDENGTFSQGIIPDACMVLDNGFDQPRFLGTNCSALENNITFGTTAGTGAQAWFSGCNSTLNILVLGSPNGPARATVIGPTSETVFRFSATGIQMDGLITENFGTDVTVNSKRGIFWNNDTLYGIFRAAGAWVGSFIQLTIAWATGIILDPGSSSTKSVVYIPQGGLVASSVNYIATETGVNNAIAAAFSSTNPALAGGLVVTVKLAHSLQAGANTFNYNGGGAVSIVKHTNPAANITAAYATNGTVVLVYDAGLAAWLDLSQ